LDIVWPFLAEAKHEFFHRVITNSRQATTA